MAKGIANHAWHQTKRVELLGPLGWPVKENQASLNLSCGAKVWGLAKPGSPVCCRGTISKKWSHRFRHVQLCWAGGGKTSGCQRALEEYKKQLPRRSMLPWSVWKVSFQSTKHMLKVDSQEFSSEVCIFDNFSMFFNNVYFLVMDCFYSNSNFRELYFSKSQNPK